MSFEKKTYTMEDNVRSMMFCVKNIEKLFQELNKSIEQLTQMVGHLSNSSHKTNDKNDLPF